MTKSHVAAALLAFGSLAVLPACSQMFPQTSRAAPMASPELSSGMVRQVQTALQQQGIYTGNIDGLWGPATQSAVQSFQKSHGLRVTGELDAPTLAALNVPASSAAPDASTSSTAPTAPPVAPAAPTVAPSSTAPVASPAR
jgi:peptidoglycan hydrolase-like protein with peptidoglycan-binding domain